jgi:DNA-binding CsgD family transcriptional regulator
VALIEHTLSSARAGGGTFLLVEGAAGLGKTALLGHAAELAERHRLRTLTALGHELERALAFGGARQLFEPTVSALGTDVAAALFTGPARAAGELLAGRRVEVPEGEQLELIHGFYRLCARLAERGPLALLVDDLQWLDTSSLAFLLYLAQRIGELPVAVVAMSRPGEPEAPSGLMTRLGVVPGVLSATLAPLTATATEKLVHARFPEADEEFVRAATSATGGNPFLTEELMSAVRAAGLPPDATTARRAAELAPESLLRWTLVRLERMPPGSRELVEALAVLGGEARLRRAAALAGLAPEDAARSADALAGVAILTPGDPAGFVHPLIQAAVYAQIPDATRADRHRVAARLIADEGDPDERVAAQLLEASPTGDPWAVERLRAAAREALARGAADSASRFLVRAVEEPPHEVDRGHVLAEAAQAEALVGHPRAIDRMRDAVELLGGPHDRAEALYRFGWMLYGTGRLSEAAEVFAQGLAELPVGNDELAQRLHTAEMSMRSITATIEIDTEELPPSAAHSPATDPTERELLTQLALRRVIAGEGRDQAIDLATRALGGGAMVADEGVTISFAVAASCLVWSDELDVVEDAIEKALAECRRQGTYAGTVYVTFGRSWVRYWRGRVSEAAAESGTAVQVWRGGWGGQISIARLWQAVSLVELGRLDEAADVVDGATPEEHRDEPMYVSFLALARGRVALARGDYPSARRALISVDELATAVPLLQNANVLPWRTWGATAALLDGDVEEARRLSEEDVRLARRFGAPRGLGSALRVSGLVEGGERGLALLREAAAVLEQSPSRLEHMRALVDLGAALRRAGARSEAREPLRRAMDLAAATGAVVLRDRARDELVAAGGRPRRAQLSGGHALTPSERRVAELALAGRTNPEIARELFISRKTVEFHLQGAYRKLGIRSRDELADTLRQSVG